MQLNSERKKKEGTNKLNKKMQSMIMACKRSACRLLSIRTFAPISKVTESIPVHVHVYLVKSETSLMI